MSKVLTSRTMWRMRNFLHFTIGSSTRQMPKCQTVYANFHTRPEGDGWGGGCEPNRYPHQVENFHSLFLLARQCVGKCLFRIRPSVIYGPITFNFTCGPPRGMQITGPFPRWPRTRAERKKEKSAKENQLQRDAAHPHRTQMSIKAAATVQ